MSSTPGETADSLATLRRREQACVEFEAAWKAHRTPLIEDFLRRCAHSERAGLFRELLALELAYRRLRGDTLDSDEYLVRFAEFADVVSATFAASTLTLTEQFPVADASHPSQPTVDPGSPGVADAQRSDASAIDELLNHIAGLSHFEERYAMLGELARGGMGQILAAFDRILCRKVAVKMRRLEHTDPGSRGQFLKEARVGARLLHPNLLAVLDVGVNRQGQIYFTMRLVNGASFDQSLKALDCGCATNLVAFPLRRVVEAFVRVCQGVDYAHQNRVLNLDLKPANILISGFNEVFVVDWGLARVDDEDDTERLIDIYRDWRGDPEVTGGFGPHVVGTPAYMAPEQAEGDLKRFGFHTDVYGLGGILYEILYNRRPNQGHSISEIRQSALMKKQRCPLRDGIVFRGQRTPKNVRDSLDVLEQICLKALEPELEHRYGCVEELIIDLNDWLKQTPL